MLVTAASVGALVAYTGSYLVAAGQTIEVRSNNTSGVNNASSTLFIERVSGASAITAAETVATRSNDSSTSLSGAFTTIVWTNKNYDTHNAFSAGVFTVPVSGKYLVNCLFSVAGTFTAGQNADIVLQKNGSNVSEFIGRVSGSQTAVQLVINDIIECVAGDTLRIQVAASVGASPTVNTSTTQNVLAIAKIGI
jgi:hypothetical protein